MTGYGKAELQNDNIVLSVEIRSVNSRFLDFTSRFTKHLTHCEDLAHKKIKEKCTRGRISLFAKLEYLDKEENSALKINDNKLGDYLNIIETIETKMNVSNTLKVGDVLKLPDILLSASENDSTIIRDIFIEGLDKAIVDLESNREYEGSNIKKDLEYRISEINKMVAEIEKYSLKSKEQNFKKYKEKIINILKEFEFDEARVYQEAAIISEKKDITEEIVRINSHIELFISSINSKYDEGKKLNFILQEIGREINTIGSKTDYIEISHLAVNIKDELEKIREQVQNIV